MIEILILGHNLNSNEKITILNSAFNRLVLW